MRWRRYAWPPHSVENQPGISAPFIRGLWMQYGRVFWWKIADFRRESHASCDWKFWKVETVCAGSSPPLASSWHLWKMKTLFQGGFTYWPNLSASAATSHLVADWSTAGRGKNIASLLMKAHMPFFLDYSKLRESNKQQNRPFDFFLVGCGSFSAIRCFWIFPELLS